MLRDPTSRSIPYLMLDPAGAPTRGTLFRRGPNRGRGRPEQGGKWRYVGGQLCSAGHDERSAHGAWARAVEEMGHIVGYTSSDGVVCYHVWVPDAP